MPTGIVLSVLMPHADRQLAQQKVYEDPAWAAPENHKDMEMQKNASCPPERPVQLSLLLSAPWHLSEKARQFVHLVLQVPLFLMLAARKHQVERQVNDMLLYSTNADC